MVNGLTMLEALDEWAIGHERLLNEGVRIWNNVSRTYPPHNLIKKSSDEYVITVAVAGFSKEDLSVRSEEGTLTIESKKSDSETKDEYVYKGIANRSFKKEFLLAENVFVKDVKLKDGMLEIFLERVIPENEKETIYQIN
tara:strand:- start:140 stop:559 length:420 start_codon:yes stop_codon:yes gene_type:complete